MENSSTHPDSAHPNSTKITLKNLPDSYSKIKVAVCDIDGLLRGKYLHRDKFLSAAENGFGFCNVVFGWDSSDLCYDNSKFTGWHTGYPDALVRIDLNTFRQIPWENQLPFFLGDFETPDGKGLAICPRQTLKRIIEQAHKMGFELRCGMEFEWFNFRETCQSLAEKNYKALETLTPGMFGYSITRTTLNQPYFSALMDELSLFRIPLEGLHTETGPGVLEAAIQYSDPLEAADRAVLFKTAAKEIGQRFGIMPTFMAKWNDQLPGCSGHLHQSLWHAPSQLSHSDASFNASANTISNAFYDKGRPNGMSPLFESYIAGQLACLPDLLPFYAPTVNSYKRLVDGFWAPTKASWGVDNRTTALRVIPGSSKSTRLETRVPGSDVNPYLAMSAAIASGLYGIRKNLKLNSPAVVGSAYLNSSGERLPRTLWEATDRMVRSSIARELFGDEGIDHFANTRIWEWRQFQDSVTDWELKRYFEII